MGGIFCKDWTDWTRRTVGTRGRRAVMYAGSVTLWLSLLALAYVACRLSSVEQKLLGTLGPDISNGVLALRALRILIWACFCLLSFNQCVLNPMLYLRALQEVLPEVERQQRAEPRARWVPGSDEDDQPGGESVGAE